MLDTIVSYNNQYLNSVSSRSSDTLADWQYDQLKVTLYQWAEAGLHIALKLEDYTLAESMIASLTVWHWQQMYFGIQMREEDWVEATQVLNTIPQQTQDQIYFKQVQELNLSLQQLVMGQDSFAVSEIDNLRNIAFAGEPSSAYAKTLFKLIMGEVIPMVIPDWDDLLNREGQENRVETYNNEIHIYPNPVNHGEVTIDSELKIEDIAIYDRLGKKVYFESDLSINRAEIGIDGLENGLLLIEIRLENGEISHRKLIKH